MKYLLMLFVLAFTTIAMADNSNAVDPNQPAVGGPINWLTTNWASLLAVWGALCLIAREVVRWTPTPKDDAALDKVAGWLKALGVIFGLNLKQGR